MLQGLHKGAWAIRPIPASIEFGYQLYVEIMFEAKEDSYIWYCNKITKEKRENYDYTEGFQGSQSSQRNWIKLSYLSAMRNCHSTFFDYWIAEDYINSKPVRVIILNVTYNK